MVYFTCNHCGDSLSKPKVSKHYQIACSRQPINLTCCDCHRDFRENEYETHTKCISEQEKYSDKNFVAKPNKGEEKQAAWVEAVQSLINETHDVKPVVKRILEKVAAFDNVPRKKAKFLNFIRNSNGKNIGNDILEEVWSLLEEKLKTLGNKENNLNKLETSESNGMKQDQDHDAMDIKPSEEHIKSGAIEANDKPQGKEEETPMAEVIQSIINENQDMKPSVNAILNKLALHGNIPRSKKKVFKLVRSDHRKDISDEILEEIWSLLEGKLKIMNNDKGNGAVEEGGTSSDKMDINGVNNVQLEDQHVTNGKNVDKNKKKRKMENNDLNKLDANESDSTKQDQDHNAMDIEPNEEHVKIDTIKMNGKPQGKEKETPMTKIVQSVMNENQDMKPSIKAILNKLALHNNVPRSKQKLFKVIRSNHGEGTSEEILEKIWILLEEKLKIMNNNKKNDVVKEGSKPNDKKDMNGTNNGQFEGGQQVMNGNNVDKNKKKRKMENNECGADVSPKVQKLSTNDQVSQFAWQEEIMNVLNSNENEIDIKKLRKKLIECYASFIDFDKLLMKKLNKIKGLVVHDDLVKLANE